MTKKSLDPDTLDALRRGTLDGRVFKLPPDLPRGLYVKCNDALTRAGGSWDRKARGHVFGPGVDPAAALGLVAATGQAPPKNPLAYWPTPAPVAAEMVRNLLQMPGTGNRLLEPSAGAGALILAYRAYAGGRGGLDQDPTEYTAVEVEHRHAAALAESLRGRKARVFMGADFLKTSRAYLGGPFGRVLMNPPFAVEGDSRAYATHIGFAWGMLAPGGRLVAVAPAGFTFDKRLADFLAFVEANGFWTETAEGAFRESGTDTKCVLVVLDKPAAP